MAEQPSAEYRVLDLAIVPVKPCSWRDRFQDLWQRIAKGDVAFVTTDGAVARGMDKLNFDAQKTQVPDIVWFKGNTDRDPRDSLAQAGWKRKCWSSRNGLHLDSAMRCRSMNGYGEAGIADDAHSTAILEDYSYQQLVVCSAC